MPHSEHAHPLLGHYPRVEPSPWMSPRFSWPFAKFWFAKADFLTTLCRTGR
jgi:hypothetical protein